MNGETGSSAGEPDRDEGTPDERGSLDRAADHALAALSRVPPLALVAVAAALLELALARAIWHGMNETLDAETLFALRRLARFPRNLAAVAGLVALVTATFSFLRHPGYAPIGRRLVVAAFSGIFVPSIAVAALMPAQMLRRNLVLFALAAANVLVTLLGMTGARYRAEGPVRTAVGLAGASAFLTLSVVGLGQLAYTEDGILGAIGSVLAENPTTTQRLLLTLRHFGELAWIGVLIAGAIASVWERGKSDLRGRVAALVGLTVAIAAGLVVLQHVVGHRFRFLLFGTFRFGLLVDDLPVAYVLPVAIGLAGGIVALARRDSSIRQLGAGMLLWLAAGFAPHTPIQLLYLVLGAMLLARTAQARDPVGAWRRKNPWARFSRPARVEAPPAPSEER